MFKTNKKLRKEIENLKKELQEKNEEYERLNKENFENINTIANLHRQIADNSLAASRQQDKIDDLEHQIAILKQYYRLDETPTDEERYKVMLDAKYHDLEQENMRLRMSQDFYFSLRFSNACHTYLASMLYQPYQMLPGSSRWC